MLFLLSLCVEQRASRVGLTGKGVTLKLTYADMKGITRSRISEHCDSAMLIYREAVSLLEQVEKRPVRLIGVSLYNLSEETWRQLSFEDILEDKAEKTEREFQKGLAALQEKYHLDFAGHLEELYHSTTLHRTVEYMRKHMPRTMA